MGMQFSAEQKLLAIMAISPNAHLELRKLGEWDCMVPGLDIKDRHMLKGIRGKNKSPELAIERAWQEMTVSLPGHCYLLTRPGETRERRAFRWNGFMWEFVDEESWAALHGWKAANA